MEQTQFVHTKGFTYFIGLSKALVKAGKEKECEKINRWRKACIRHFYWSITSSRQHQGDVKYAKFESFLSHVVNEHTNLPNKIFNKCAHSPIVESDHPHAWLTKGMINPLSDRTSEIFWH
jgi:hypothetical protein